MLNQPPISLLTGCRVGWHGAGGTLHQGEVTSYREGGRLLQVKLDTEDDTRNHVWLIADIREQTDDEAFFIIRHGPRSIEYGLALADQILQGKHPRMSINTQMTTLAATVVALHDQLNSLSGASQDAPAENQEARA